MLKDKQRPHLDQATQKDTGQKTQQGSVRYPSSMGVFATVHVITV